MEILTLNKNIEELKDKINISMERIEELKKIKIDKNQEK